MWSQILIVLGSWLAITVSKTVPISYDKFKVLRVKTPDLNSVNVINNDLKDYVDIWAEPRLGFYSDIMVSSHDLLMIEQRLFAANLDYSIMIENVQTLIDNENVQSNLSSNVRAMDHPMDWTSYHSQDDMEKYMDYLVEKYPEFVSTEVIGKSYEGRTMRILKICRGGTCGQKPAMWIDAGIHSREWVTSSTATYIMNELVENGEKYPLEIIDQLDWYILPVLNPDGYEYSRTSDRMWRKSR